MNIHSRHHVRLADYECANSALANVTLPVTSLYNHYYSSRFGHSCFVLKLVAGQRSSLQQQLQSVSLCHLTADTQILSCINRLH